MKEIANYVDDGDYAIMGRYKGKGRGRGKDELWCESNHSNSESKSAVRVPPPPRGARGLGGPKGAKLVLLHVERQ